MFALGNPRGHFIPDLDDELTQGESPAGILPSLGGTRLGWLGGCKFVKKGIKYVYLYVEEETS
jgi:hypothetical protein